MKQRFNEDSVQKFYGLSTDSKPTGCSMGSVFIEIDTQKKYIFNSNAASWVLVPASSASIVIDSAMSSTSENPVQNKAIYEVLTPISESDYETLQTKTNPVYFIYEDD